MGDIWIQRAFRPIKKYTPRWFSSLVRRLTTAIVTPILFSFRTGHFKSSLKAAPVSKRGEPIPWYTYPCIDLLRRRSFSGKSVVEFGGGYSTLWWASQADRVVTFEDNEEWYNELVKLVPSNVSLHLVSRTTCQECVSDVQGLLEELGVESFDIVVVDGLHRAQMCALSPAILAPNGAIICDNSEGYGIYESFRNTILQRVDFYGKAPGVVLNHTTSVFFQSECFLFDPKHEIQEPWND